MGEPFLGEIRMFANSFAPRGWSDCNGQVMGIGENPALFALLGTMYGGDGRSTFGLPEFRGRVPVSTGSYYPQGTPFGYEKCTLYVEHLPAHGHGIQCDSNPASQTSPADRVMAIEKSGRDELNKYSKNPNNHMAPTGQAGGSQSHDNMPPFLVVRFCICMDGLFPSRN